MISADKIEEVIVKYFYLEGLKMSSDSNDNEYVNIELLATNENDILSMIELQACLNSYDIIGCLSYD